MRPRRWPRERYGLILADPPWLFQTRGRRGPKAAPYSVLSIQDLWHLPVWEIAADDSVCVIWTIQTHLDQAIELLKIWGFKFKTAGAWAKLSSTGKKWAFGTGFIYRCATEFFIVGTKGKPKVSARNVRNLIVAANREHSRKPDRMYEDLEALWPRARKVELFARTRRRGWTSWGNQVGKFA